MNLRTYPVWILLLALAALLLAAGRTPPAPASATVRGDYAIGSPVLTTLWVDPVHGSDGNSGDTRSQALRTITAAWQRIPAGAPLTGAGYRIELVAGDYGETNFPVYWEDRHGTAAFPIWLNSVDGPGAARLHGSVNVFNVEYFYLTGLAILNAGDVFHCEQCRYVLLREVHLDGGDRLAHETVKVNQSAHIYIERSDIHGAGDNAVDFVAVQHGHLRNNRVHDAQDWCIYVKGGSAYITVAGNEIFDCGVGGFTAGQGTGFEFMVAPWLHYEAYAVAAINNVIHDTEGAGLGVNGGYHILLAYNTLYRVGARSHVAEFVFGLRSCDGDLERCELLRTLGGWGVAQLDNEQPIPNRGVYFLNNVIVNPAGAGSAWQHFAIHGPRSPASGSNIPAPARTDDELVIRGNVIWNGPADHPLGVEEDAGCQPGHPTCTAAQLVAENAINTVQPLFVNAAAGDYRLSNPGALPAPAAIPAFAAWGEFTPAVPASTLSNQVPGDRDDRTRAGYDLVGAYAADGAPPLTGTPGPTPTARASFLPWITRPQP